MPNLNSSWTPTASEADLPAERAWLVGFILTGVSYGIVLTLTTMCVRLLAKSMNREITVQRGCLLLYVACIFVLSTLYIGAETKMAELSFIDFRLFPGGPAAFEKIMCSGVLVGHLGDGSFVLANWLSDALLVWRCMVIYRDCRYSRLLMALPALTFFTTFVLGIFWLMQIFNPNSSVWHSITLNFTAPYLWLSLGMNISITLAIVARLFVHRRRITRVFGSTYGVQYLSISAMLIESAAIYATFSIMFLILFGLNSSLQNLFLLVLGNVQVISPLLIIYRVASGAAWSISNSTQLTMGVDTSRSNDGLNQGKAQKSTVIELGGDILEKSRDTLSCASA